MARKSKAQIVRSFTECPTACSGRYATRQRDLLAGELSEITGKARDIAHAEPGMMRKCTYCSAVYRRGFAPSDPPRLLGHLDGMSGKGWHPVSGLA
jgi:hypothetical protein